MHSTLKIDALLSAAAQSGSVAGGVPGLIAAVCNREGVLYEGAFGARSLGEPTPMTVDTVVWIASLSKALTATAAMQLVEKGQLSLDEPAAGVVPELGKAQVLEGFDAAGSPQLRPARKPITLRHLLTHTSGLSYELFNTDIARYHEVTGTPSILGCHNAALMAPLLFDPGTRWEYSIGIDWAGKMVEAVSGQRIGDYLQKNLFAPLAMTSTSFKLGASQRSRLAGMQARMPDGALALIPFEVPQEPEFEMSGGGLYSCVPDYVRFLRMILGSGTLDGIQVLKPETVAMMRADQVPGLSCGAFGTAAPTITNAGDFYPGQSPGWGLSFLINRHPVPGGRSAGSLSWAGVANSYYWIDPARDIAAVLTTQLLPFFDAKMVALFEEFEQVVYRSFSA